MATTIKLKNSVTTTNAPSSLVQGEVAINITDKKVWVGNAATTPIQLLGDGGSASFTSIAFGAGTVSSPSITFTGDTNTGIYSPAADTIAFTEGGVESMRINSSGNVGIGTSSPTSKLDVNGIATAKQAIIADGANGNIQFGSTSTYNIVGGVDNEGLRYNLPTGMNHQFRTNATERMRIDSSGNVGIGTSSPAVPLDVVSNSSAEVLRLRGRASDNIGTVRFTSNDGATAYGAIQGRSTYIEYATSQAIPLIFTTNSSERMRITSGGDLLVNKTSSSTSTNGFSTLSNGRTWIVTTDVDEVLLLNRQGSDGNLVRFFAQNTEEGTISVSGTTVSYNGGHLSRWSQLPDNSKDNTILKGTVMSNLDDMCVWVKDGKELPNEQLNKMKVSDVEGDINVAGVFVNWTFDEQTQSDDMNVAMTGDMIIRIAEGVVVQKGDLLMSAGDGTAKPQGDDIRKSKTVAKVTSNHVTCTYADGSYCVPCVLMAC